MSMRQFLKRIHSQPHNIFNRSRRRATQPALKQLVSVEAVESRMLLTPVLALNPVAGLEGDMNNFDGHISGVAVGNGLDKFQVYSVA